MVGTGWSEKLIWLDNSKYNKYDISFEALSGSDTKEIISQKGIYIIPMIIFGLIFLQGLLNAINSVKASEVNKVVEAMNQLEIKRN